ncbi:CYRIA/CYRIB Rac1 binding domain-containing protein [Entamoeba marina]
MGGKHSKAKEPALELNFNAQPTADENEVHTLTNQIISKSANILEQISSYKPKENEIRAAIASPSAETEEAAWQAILPQVQIINGFFEYGKTMKTGFISGIEFLCKISGPQCVTQHQATSNCLIEMINFSVQFDNMKLSNPGLQNDFSYYRRSIGKMKTKHRDDVFLRDDVTNQISMFFAFAAPMILNLSEALSDAVKNGVSLDNIACWIKTVATSCSSMSAKKGDEGVKCLRVMTGCILLYDAVVPLGAFNPKSGFRILDCVRSLKNYTESPDEVAMLINSLKYSTKHFNDEETPKGVKVLLL